MPDVEDPYGEGFAEVFASNRYAVFSQRLARLALQLIAEHGAPGVEAVDLACGAGAGSVVLARAGFQVTGLDRSATMLELAARRATKEGFTFTLQQQDMETFTLSKQVDVVTCLFDALNYVLAEDALARVFARVAGCLVSGGLFVFDMNTVSGLATRWGTRDVVDTERDDLIEVNRYRFDAAQSINTVTTSVFVRQQEDLFRRYRTVHRERGYSVETVSALLAEAGLETCAVHGLPDGELMGRLQPLTDEIGRMMVVARRAPRHE